MYFYMATDKGNTFEDLGLRQGRDQISSRRNIQKKEGAGMRERVRERQRVGFNYPVGAQKEGATRHFLAVP